MRAVSFLCRSLHSSCAARDIGTVIRSIGQSLKRIVSGPEEKVEEPRKRGMISETLLSCQFVHIDSASAAAYARDEDRNNIVGASDTCEASKITEATRSTDACKTCRKAAAATAGTSTETTQALASAADSSSEANATNV
jgi:hypothetical protein